MIFRCIGFTALLASAVTGLAKPPQTVATFHSVGLYWSPPGGAPDNPCSVAYRAEGAGEWKPALPLWFDPSDHGLAERRQEYRGSLVNLHPGSKYEVKLTLQRGPEEIVRVSTWSEQFRIKGRHPLPTGTSGEPIVIADGGSAADGFVLYESDPAHPLVLDLANRHPVGIEIRASFVILRGVTVRGAQRHDIVLGDVHDVVIEHCDLSGWGRDRDATSGLGENYDAGIYSESKRLERVVVQRCRIHDPRSAANAWGMKGMPGVKENGHPQGPQAIVFAETGGNHVIRYNEITSDEKHGFNDGIGAWENRSYVGFPNRDSDIYCNRIANSWDDAIEAEGADMNCRIWGNVMDHTFMTFGLASPSLGPLYVFRNVSGFARRDPPGVPDARGPYPSGGGFFKLGAGPAIARYAAGKLYLFHNTIGQPVVDGKRRGDMHGIIVTGPTYVADNIESRNNILDVRSPKDDSLHDPQLGPPHNDFDYDLMSGVVKAAARYERHGIHGRPVYAIPAGAGRIDPVLAAGSPGSHAAAPLPNVNDGPAGARADMGAGQAGAPPIVAGIRADWNANLPPP